MKKSDINKKKGNEKYKLSNKNILLVLGLVYTLITIIAIVSYVSRMQTISTTPVTISTIFSDVWWQLLMIILFAVTYVLYTKKTVLASLVEMIMGMAMLIYMVISIALIGINIFALIVELIYPLILIFQGLIEFKRSSQNLKRKKSTI